MAISSLVFRSLVQFTVGLFLYPEAVLIFCFYWILTPATGYILNVMLPQGMDEQDQSSLRIFFFSKRLVARTVLYEKGYLFLHQFSAQREVDAERWTGVHPDDG